MIPATIASIEDATPSIKRFILETSEPYAFLPGQWLDLRVESSEKLGGYSICSAPKNDLTTLELAIKKSEQHPVTQALWEKTQVGDKVEISSAQGACTFRSGLGDKVILIAGGIGITPMMSIFRHIRDLHDNTQVALIYSASDPQEFIFQEEIRRSADEHEHVLAVFSCTDLEADLPDWIHFQEQVDFFFLKTMNLPRDAHYFICGPQGMLSDVEKSLLKLEVSAGHIHSERW